jgi:hypothetical protein
MHAFVRSIAVSAALVLGAAASAQAGDLCLDLGGVLYVGKSLSLPSKGGCKTWKGVAGLCGSGTGMSTGTICRDSQGGEVYTSIVTTCPGEEGVAFDHATLPYPSLSGGTESFYVADIGFGGFSSPFSASQVPCVPGTVPIPKADNPEIQALRSR